MSSTPTTYTTKDSPHFLAEPNSKTITFRSSDGTLFHIEKLYAMAGSGVWRDRIEIGGKAAEAIAGGGEVVDLTEPTDLISVLLHYVVPELSPDTTKFTLLNIEELLEAARKYAIPRASSGAGDQLLRMRTAGLDTIAVYALACKYELR